ncbi:MAG: phosphohydrolase [Phormidesmis priestleyi]|uniref:Phosphohydrolase n=1 Tax=Phormidesmis priestleyi TaxID=268141 RepID=A0A2W4X871_9CYAN|nr:MAG: phosphohydrolase [Phormidesmis priestleyi]
MQTNRQTDRQTDRQRVVLGERFEQALLYAAQLHRQQRRKVTGVPYISHLLGVAALVIEDGGCEDSAISALLHDAVEDQGGLETLAVIRSQFGEQVADWVWACSASPRPMGQSWRSHKAAYLQQVRQAPAEVRRIILADKLHNGLSLLVNLSLAGSSIWDEFSGTQADIIWFYQACCKLFPETDWMAARLRAVRQALEDS